MVIGILVLGLLLLFSGIIYCTLIGLFTSGWYRQGKPSGHELSNPPIKVSVIIAARNEEKHIIHLLNDILSQDYPKDFTEIIVVDDHSNDETHKLVGDFISECQFKKIKLIKNEGAHSSGKKAALALGISHAAGDIVITTDADCRVGTGWIFSLTSRFIDEHIMMVFGPVSYFSGKNLSDHFQTLEFAGLIASGAGSALAGHPFLCSGTNLAYRKSAFLQVKGFEGNENFISGDDVFLMHKMKKGYSGRAIRFCKDKNALVQTYPAAGILKFIRQRVRWASKSKGYRDHLAAATSLSVFVFNGFLLITLFAGFINAGYFLLFAGFLLLKLLIDLPLMWGITGFTGQQRLMKWYIPFQLAYPFYIVVAGILSVFRRRRW